MDTVVLATNIVTALSPFLIKGAEEFAKEVGKEVFEKTKQLKYWLWARIKDSNDKKVTQTTLLFESDPATFGDVMKKVLADYLKSHPHEAQELVRFVDGLPADPGSSKYGVQIQNLYGANFGDFGVINQNFGQQDK